MLRNNADVRRCSGAKSQGPREKWSKPKIPFHGLFLVRNRTETLATQAKWKTSSETQGQIVGATESLNGRKNKARRNYFSFMPYFPACLDFSSPPLSAPGSPRMSEK